MIRRLAALSLTAFCLALAAGCGSGGTASSSGSGTLTFSASGATLTFASTMIGSSAGAQTVTVTNSGSAAITLSSVLLTGNNQGDFTMLGSCVGISSLATGATCTLSVNFMPTVAGSRTAIINFTDTSSNHYQLTLTGTGTAAPTPAVTLSVNSLIFNAVTNGVVTAAQNVTLTNSGTATLTGIGITLTGANVTNFGLPTSTSPCGATLAAGANCIISVNFTAPTAGGYSAAVSIADNATGSPQTISLIGAGAAPLGDFAPSPGALNFGATVVASASTAQSLTFINTGNAPDTITLVALSGTNAADFTETDNCTSVAAGSNCIINVTFTPAATGARSAILTVTDNSNGTAGTTHTATIAGNGVATSAPAVTLSTTALTFATNTGQVTITNSGASAVSFTGITIGGTNPTVFSQANDCSTATPLVVGGSCTVTVTFAPAGAAGNFSATLNIADNALPSPQTVTLTATTAPVATLSPNSLTLNSSTLATASVAQTVRLTNSGTATMSNIGATITGTNAAAFAISSNSCGTGSGTLAIGANCTISVTFTPAANGTVTATLNVADNAAGSPQTASLVGNGPGAATTTMTLVTVPDDTYPLSTNTFVQVNNFISSATSTVEMEIYQLTDATMIQALVNQCKAGVTVRVILDNSQKSTNQTAYNTINAQTGCTAQFSNTHFPNTHEKSIAIDAAIPSKAQVLISTGNFNNKNSYYTTGRDFQLYENNANDIAAWETTFAKDWLYPAGTTYPTSPRFTPPPGDDLVWSPSIDLANSRTAIGAVIANATTTLVVDQEEMSASACFSALAAAAQRGVNVKLTVPADAFDTATKQGYLTTMKNAGVHVNAYPSSGNYLYIHAKVIVADFGLPNETAFMGSENCSDNSLSSNRELGIVLTDSTASVASSIIQTLNTKLTNDFACVSKAPTQATASCTSP